MNTQTDTQPTSTDTVPTDTVPTQTPNLARSTFAASATELLRVVDTLSDDQWHLPTASSEFDATALLEHVLAVLHRVTHTLATGSVEGSPFSLQADDLASALHTGATRTLAALADTEVFDGDVEVPWGRTSRVDAVLAWADELAVHTWDLAWALGSTATLDPALPGPALARYRHLLPAGARPEFIPFDDEVEVPADADAWSALVAFTGRDPQQG